MKETFCLRPNRYNLRNINIFATNNPRNKLKLDPSVYWADQWWQTLPFEIKDFPSLQLFKSKIKTWCCGRFQCQICSRYLANVQCALLTLQLLLLLLLQCKWPKCHFAVKTTNLYILQYVFAFYSTLNNWMLLLAACVWAQYVIRFVSCI